MRVSRLGTSPASASSAPRRLTALPFFRSSSFVVPPFTSRVPHETTWRLQIEYLKAGASPCGLPQRPGSGTYIISNMYMHGIDRKYKTPGIMHENSNGCRSAAMKKLKRTPLCVPACFDNGRALPDNDADQKYSMRRVYTVLLDLKCRTDYDGHHQEGE